MSLGWSGLNKDGMEIVGIGRPNNEINGVK